MHIDLLCTNLQAIESKKTQRVIANIIFLIYVIHDLKWISSRPFSRDKGESCNAEFEDGSSG